MEEAVLKPALAGLFVGVAAFAAAAGEPLGLVTFFQAGIPRAWSEQWQGIAGLADQHILDRAARLAAGIPQAVAASGDPPGQLRSVFCGLVSADGRQAPAPQFWPVRALELDEMQPFPSAALPPAETRARCAGLWKEFITDAGRLARSHDAAQVEDLEQYLESLLLLLQRYTWCVPSFYAAQFPDVSAYDHARTTAALAALLSAPQPTDPAGLALLVGGDITGVESFVYNITGNGGLEALRGRAFYVQLLTEIIARCALRELNLPIANLLYAGGGSFIILARPTDPLDAVRRKVDAILLRHHQGDLSLALGGLPLAEVDFFNGKVSQRWGDLADCLRDEKLRPFSELDGERFAQIFEPQGSGDPDHRCPVCGGEHSGVPAVPESDGAGPAGACPSCLSYEKLGGSLSSAAFLVLEPGAPLPDEERGGYQEVFHDLGWRVELQRDPPDAGDRPRAVLALSGAALRALPFLPHAAVGRRHVVNVPPLVTAQDIQAYRHAMTTALQPGAIKPLGLLRAQSRGVPCLGILRIDQDDLGHLFVKGFGRSATLARVASLSFATGLFFEGWVGRLASQINEEAGARGAHGGGARGGGARGGVYCVYSGGDDLCFAGSWDRVVELARRIRRDLTRFAAGHPGIHASAGIALADGTCYLAEAAGDAARAGRQAKAHRWQSNGQEHVKDAVCFLGQALDWPRLGLEEEGKEGFTSASLLAGYLARRPELEPLRRELISFHEMYRRAQRARIESGGLNRPGTGQPPQALWGPWNWQCFAALNRVYRETGSPDVRALNDRLKADNFTSIEWIGLAAKWAGLLSKKE